MLSSRHAALFVTVVCVLAGGCVKRDPPALAFPASISFDEQRLEKGDGWIKDRMWAVAYGPPAEQPPAISIQVGVILSDRHLTARDLHSWVREEAGGSGDAVLYYSDRNDESCKVGGNPQRTYVALEVCKTGVARAACVEADEALDTGILTACGSNRQCYSTVCDRQWLKRREALDLLAADMLTVR